MSVQGGTNTMIFSLLSVFNDASHPDDLRVAAMHAETGAAVKERHRSTREFVVQRQREEATLGHGYPRR